MQKNDHQSAERFSVSICNFPHSPSSFSFPFILLLISLSLPPHKPPLSPSVWFTVSVSVLSPLQARGEHHKLSTLPSLAILSNPSLPHLILFPLLCLCKDREHSKDTVRLLLMHHRNFISSLKYFNMHCHLWSICIHRDILHSVCQYLCWLFFNHTGIKRIRRQMQ